MRRNILLFCIVFFCSTFCFSQTISELEKKYNNETIYRFGVNKYLKGSERLSFNALRNEFDASPLGLDLYNGAKKYKNISTVLRLVSLAASIATLSFAASRDKNKMLIGFVVQFASMFAANRYSTSYIEQTDRALWQRNKDVLFR
jgi:hypothetical protein